jgi:hypothetical protein
MWVMCFEIYGVCVLMSTLRVWTDYLRLMILLCDICSCPVLSEYALFFSVMVGHEKPIQCIADPTSLLQFLQLKFGLGCRLCLFVHTPNLSQLFTHVHIFFFTHILKHNYIHHYVLKQPIS